MITVSIVLTMVLIIMSAFHFYWAGGGLFALDKVLPTLENIRLLNPSKGLTLFVAIVLLGFAYISYSLGFKDSSIISAMPLHYLSIIVSVVFGLRVIGDFKMIGIFKKIKKTEFASYDTYFFVPLCWILSIGFYLLQQ